MRIRNFYPKQVYLKLSGKNMRDLDPGSMYALQVALRGHRRLGLMVSIIAGQIDVKTAAEVGRMVVKDLRAAAAKENNISVNSTPVRFIQDELSPLA